MKKIVLLLCILLVTACGSKEGKPSPGGVQKRKVEVSERKRSVESPPAKAYSYTVRGRTYTVMADADGFTQEGKATWYGGKFHGRKTASGERFDTHKLTAAHKTLPFGTIVRVTNLNNNRSVDVRVNDRGPFAPGCVIDLSKAAAEKIGMKGTSQVSLEAVGR